MENSQELKTIKEGLGSFKIPSSTREQKVPKKTDDVFFNPYQEINRDLSVLVLRAYSIFLNKTPLRGCEPLCGVGIRSGRYLLETPTSDLYCNDSNTIATIYTTRNIKNLSLESKYFRVFNQDANDFLQMHHQNNKNFDFVDIDPFGSPIPFILNSIKIVGIEGLIAVTSTDLASLAGIYPKALFSKYCLSQFDERIGNIHELASRALTTGVQHVGLIINQSLIPILTFYHRHFIRSFFLRYRGVARVLDKTGFLNRCRKCQTIFMTHIGDKNVQCSKCSSTEIARVGPLYLGHLQNENLIQKIILDPHMENLGTKKTLLKVLDNMKGEVNIDQPWSYDLQALAKKVGTRIPPTEIIIEKLREKKYNSGKTHYSGSTIKTTAQELQILKILKEIV